MLVKSLKRFAIAPLLLALASCATAPEEKVSLLEQVKSRGELRCGISGRLPGFSYLTTEGTYTGLDTDICRAVAAATLGDPDKVDYTQLTAAQRFTALSSGEIDLLSRNTTQTLSRDSGGGNGLVFAPVVFYDGQGVLVSKDSGATTLEDLEGESFCVGGGTTTERNLNDVLQARGISFEPVKFETPQEREQAYLDGRCAAITADRSSLNSSRSGFENPDDHVILDEVLSKEPLAPATVDGDDQWADAVRWTVYGLMSAEEQGITQANIDEQLASATSGADQENAALRRFLGIEGDLGSKLGLPNDFVVQAVRAVGNYGEIYDRHLGRGTSTFIPRGLNASYTDGGLHYAPPFN
ncbi:amino acid ABC transporter substrate-binding protein [Candidatus Synechococcus spongiarum]|uniref:Amino acid ABC transporter, periplasmic amino acid-binding protein n=1 Tax=Candidatus Synechococcus spongiarum TaxID=431041 RepID=A0A165AG92_9SYNE|nr:amino acid ABC transporter substrate-binding protein [Candidatus Synechococcus spongiarum]SAY39090.1 Amino acid ABC transporter, periplasmic amino acid-binding protein [Candidatus Synechococcus spongiarum]